MDKLLKFNEEIGKLRKLSKSYDVINRYMSNNDLNTLDKVRSAIQVSNSVSDLFEFFDKNE